MKIAEFINQNLDIADEYYEIFGKEIPNGKFFCPFHSNTNTPAAKRYGNGIKCFGQCNHYYTTYDLLKRFNPRRIDEIKASIIIEQSAPKTVSSIRPVQIDRTLPISQILNQICG